MKRILALLLGLSVLTAGMPAGADMGTSHPQAPRCQEVPLSAMIETFDRFPRAALVRGYAVIVEGTLESYRLPDISTDLHGRGLAVLRVDKVWKGAASTRVAWTVFTPLFFNEWPFQPRLPDCPLAIPVGERIRIGARFLAKAGDQGDGYPELDPSTDLLYLEHRWGSPYLPLHDPEFDRVLTAYQADTDALQKAATAGNEQAKLAFLEHLYDNNDGRRAQEYADALRRQGIKLPRRGLLLLSEEQKDWSDLRRMHQGCYSYRADFDSAVFDRADLAECAFRYSSFRNASFRGTDLTGSYFQDSDLTGARYDCATKLPDDLDPKAAGMINVDGECALR
ncbi:pentapeptide repeat-containing protein [Dongia sp. agr-C8]